MNPDDPRAASLDRLLRRAGRPAAIRWLGRTSRARCARRPVGRAGSDRRALLGHDRRDQRGGVMSITRTPDGWLFACPACGFERHAARRPAIDRVAADHVKTHGRNER